MLSVSSPLRFTHVACEDAVGTKHRVSGSRIEAAMTGHPDGMKASHRVEHEKSHTQMPTPLAPMMEYTA